MSNVEVKTPSAFDIHYSKFIIRFLYLWYLAFRFLLSTLPA